jgi:uncharacterized membrane protein YfcA
LDKQHLYLIPILFLVAYIWTMIGKHIVKKIDTTILRKVILWGVILMSGLLIYQWIGAL